MATTTAPTAPIAPPPGAQHVEEHFTASNTIRDIVIGMADGLTVPFALAAGLTGAIAQTRLIVTAGMAEIAAGSIAMGLGGFLAARGDAEHYANELKREYREIEVFPEIEAREVAEIFETYGLSADESESVVSSLSRRPDDFVKFMMRFELGLEEPEKGRAWTSALTIASAYIVGGFIPLSAYMFLPNVDTALWVSVGVTLLALAGFGAAKGRLTGVPALKSGIQTMLVGGSAACVAFLIARAIS
jgi:VIT1/CCC1 family predicted Fe2+/Mn2+ transporter